MLHAILKHICTMTHRSISVVTQLKHQLVTQNNKLQSVWYVYMYSEKRYNIPLLHIVPCRMLTALRNLNSIWQVMSASKS